jgi:hypothetical protein
VVEQAIWRIRTNQELVELYTDPETVADIKKTSSECQGHVVRMDQERTYKKIFSLEYSILLRIIILNIKERKCQSVATIYI